MNAAGLRVSTVEGNLDERKEAIISVLHSNTEKSPAKVVEYRSKWVCTLKQQNI